MNLKVQRFRAATIKLERQQEVDFLPPMTTEQIKKKRIINQRHAEKKPSLIGFSSPRDIQKMIDIKAARMKTQPEATNEPVLEVFPSKS